MGRDEGITRIGLNPCPYCGNKQDALGDYGKSKGLRPDPGDVAICIRCAGVQILEGPQLRPRKPTAEELAALQASPDWAETDRVIRAAKMNIQLLKGKHN